MIKEYVFSPHGSYQGMQQHTFEMKNKEIVYKNLSLTRIFATPGDLKAHLSVFLASFYM